jgi:hypothetical protein
MPASSTIVATRPVLAVIIEPPEGLSVKLLRAISREAPSHPDLVVLQGTWFTRPQNVRCGQFRAKGVTSTSRASASVSGHDALDVADPLSLGRERFRREV